MTSYIGLEPGYGAFEKQLITGDGVTTTFNLDYPVGQAGQILVSLDGIVQEPEEAYSIRLSSTQPQINFAGVPTNGARIFIVFLGRQLLTGQPVLSSPHFDQFSGNGSTTTFALTQTPVSTGPEKTLWSLSIMFIREMVLVLLIQSLAQILYFQVLHQLELTIYKLHS